MAKGRGRRGQNRASRGSSQTSTQEIPLDDVDAFHAQRDKILLDEDAASDDLDDITDSQTREVLGLADDDDNEEDEEEDNEDEVNEDEEEEEGEEDRDLDRYRTMILPPSVTEASLHRKAPRDAAHEEQDDPYAENEDEEDLELGWGANKRAYYSGNTDKDMESDSDMDEEKAHELETNEAIRLQRLSRVDMDDAEFGLDTIDAEEAQIQADEQSDAARARRRRELDDEGDQTAPPEESPETLQQILRMRAPIVLALVDEFPEALRQQAEAKAYVDAITAKGERQLAEIAHLYYQTLSSYTTLLAFFFQLACQATLLSDLDAILAHPVLERLSHFKRALVEMKQLGLFDPREDDDDEPEASLMGPATEEDMEEYEQLGDLEPNELEDLLADEKENYTMEEPARSAPPKKAPKKNKSAGSEPAAPGPAAPLSSVAHVRSEVPSRPARVSSLAMPLEEADAYGEPTQMRETERKDKAARQRAVQFHATGVDPTPSAKQRSLDGDADIPYRDRRQIREAVATAKANRAAKAKPSAPPTLEPLEEWGESDWQARDEVMGDGNDDADTDAEADAAYYDLVSSRKRLRKQADKAAYDQRRLDERVWDDEKLAPGEHRTIDYTIEKNKGLTPHRPKNVRNPRVKRRMRYDRAKKRLSSTRAVYKGGQSALQGGYSGEKSGISTHLVKSRKLGS
ncbi:Similar to S.cerevisiae protein SAS10 (Subunit of U3-containing Small Subunit (SSU) processome complex) [Malassezia sympodialis ATCC 42132]|uniref:Similar to S.cerevisiae protein SAS10 (Subunit of U3-containing Small Subunit (SSU) processome complex) n=1 Tax=Malassezia sympodialis (strain ATCC 42132) TaxID=1230383 RepID=A0A1M8A4E4_MALS4|nr:Similar to S.cerevisiae protein SAS10 (Subunit of U3-containing Small Subunit (SSU) processome complex) [Malassezia sympodialis ATCC 42132]